MKSATGFCMDSLWHAFVCAALSGNGTLWQFIFCLRNNCLLPANLAYFRECRSFKDDQMGLTDFMKKTVGLI